MAFLSELGVCSICYALLLYISVFYYILVFVLYIILVLLFTYGFYMLIWLCCLHKSQNRIKSPWDMYGIYHAVHIKILGLVSGFFVNFVDETL